MRAYPRITAHIIAESLGYATPSLAAQIIKNARDGEKNYCEWVWSSYEGVAKKIVENAIRRRTCTRDTWLGTSGLTSW